jgi:hypothetical protein
MPTRKEKGGRKDPYRDYRAQLFFVLGFIGAALTTEFITILHEYAKLLGRWYWVYSAFIVFIAWPIFMSTLVKLIDMVYLRKK